MLRRSFLAGMLALACAAAPAPAAADWLFTPFIGTTFAGSADFDTGLPGGDDFERQLTYGASLAWMGAGVFGFEFDFGYSPNYFEHLADTDDDFTFADDSNVTTLMGNLKLGAPIGGQSGAGIRPYAVAGIGLIRTQAESVANFFEIDSNDWGMNAGAGVICFFSDGIGIRGDIRYFRVFAGGAEEDEFPDFELAEFDFWRAGFGMTFRF
jgi:opacity protein-like surface antigen